jgi:hypothetical protein
MDKIVCLDVTTVDSAKKSAEISPVNGQIRQDGVWEANLAPGSVMISEDGVRNVEMIHPAVKEGAGVAVTILLKMQKVNGAVNTAYAYKPTKGNQFIDSKKVLVVIKYSYSLFECF